MMVKIAAPTLNDTIIDPAMGTAGFLAETAKYIKEEYPRELMNKESNKHFNSTMFTGYDIDQEMLRIGCMNMTLHGVDNPTIKYNNSLEEDYTAHDTYSLILANPPFSGSLNSSTVSKSLNAISGGTKSTELLFLALFMRLLKVGGRCVSIVPVGVLNNTNEKAYTKLRKELIDNQKLEGIIFMPGGIFYPYSGVQTGILIFTKTNCGGTNKVWLYNMEADGYSLNQKRDQIDDNDIPDIISKWQSREEQISAYDKLSQEEKDKTKFAKCFVVDKQEIIDNGYVFSFNKYQKKEVVKKEYRSTADIIKSINDLEEQFKAVMAEISNSIM
jgi:type I restriction enzyme M protein